MKARVYLRGQSSTRYHAEDDLSQRGDSKNGTFAVELFGPSNNAILLDTIGIGTILNDD